MSIKQENKEVRINLLLTKEFRKQYKIHCLKKDIIMSERIRELMDMDLKGMIK
jgi:predicted HTH domain antitoxin